MKYEIIEKTDKYEVALSEDHRTKLFKSPEANYIFNLGNGQMMLWGKTPEDDPVAFPAPNILDLECTVVCKGVNGKVCPFCYKANLPTNKGYMTFETFKKIFDALPKSITQIAFGADATLETNPDLWKMMEYCREHYVIPNVTAAQLDDEIADKVAKYCGACAISRYDDKDVCYDSIKRLIDRGMSQVNIHLMVSEETYDRCIETINDAATDPRLEKLNAIVCLSLKQKGRGVTYHSLSDDKFKTMTDLAIEKRVGLGFDSCGSLKALKAIGEHIKGYVLDCEAALQSSYINYKGEYFPCSFCEGEGCWKEGLNVLECRDSKDFVERIWEHPKTQHFKEILLETANHNEFKCRTCPMFTV